MQILYPISLSSILLGAAFFSGCGGGGSGPSDDSPVKAPVITPVEDFNTTFDTQTKLTIDAYDTDGNIMKYEWKIDGAIVSDFRSFLFGFTAGDHTVEVTVTDDDGLSASANFRVHVPVFTRLLKTECSDFTDTLIRKRIYSYDLHGNMTKGLYDDDGDGSVDRGVFNTYNEDNLLSVSDEDSDGDGTADYRTTNRYTADGLLSAILVDADIDGETDSASYRYYRSSPHGYAPRGETNYYPATRIEYDHDGDGRIDVISSYTYDEAGNIIRMEDDADADGLPDYIITRTYDESSILLHETRDYDGDGIAESVTTGSHTGSRSQLSFDPDNDGIIDMTSLTIWDDSGNPLSVKTDRDNDNVWDKEIVYTYDENGRLLTYSSDRDADGNIDSIRTYTYDDTGKRLTYIYDSAGDGIPDLIETSAYDDGGNLILFSRKVIGDGIILNRETLIGTCRYTYGGTYPVPGEDPIGN